MAYDPSNGIITAPVSVRDVQRALGTTVCDVGRLCRHERINKWSKCKPVVYPSVSKLHPWVDPAVQSSSPISSGFSGGILTGDPYTLATSSEWELGYQRPTGGVNSPYRLTDFAAYYHKAVCPVKLEKPIVFRAGNAGAFRLMFDDLAGAGHSFNLKTADVFPVSQYGDWRPTVVVIYDDGSKDVIAAVYFSQNRLRDWPSTGFEIGISSDHFVTGQTYTAVAMLTNFDTDGNGDVPEHGLVPVGSAAWGVGDLWPSSCSVDGNAPAAVGLAFELGADRMTAQFEQSPYMPGDNPNTGTGTWWYNCLMDLTLEQRNGDIDTFSLGGMEFWMVYRQNGSPTVFPNGDYDVSQTQMKVTVILEDCYGYDDEYLTGADTSALLSRREFTVIDWTDLDTNTNTDWESTNHGYKVQLSNYVVNAGFANRRDYIYLDNTASYPRDIVLRLFMRKKNALTVEGQVASITLTIPSRSSSHVFADDSNRVF